MTEKKMKLIAEETDRLNKKLEKLKQVEKEMKATNTEAFDAEKLSRYNSSLNQTQSAMLRTQAQLNQLAIQRQDAEKKAAAEAVARAEAEHQAEERVARKRQENEERIRREYEKSYQLYISIAEAERQADERRQAERLAAEEAARAQIKALATGGYKDIAQGVTKLNTALTQAVRTAAMLEVVLLRVGSNAVKTGAAFDASMSQVAATLNIEQVVHQQESAFARLRNAAIEYGRITTFTASEVATSLNELALGGLSVEESLSALPQVLTLAKAGSMELEKASTIVIASMKALNLSTSEVDTLLDQMTRTAQKSKVTVQETGDAILKTASAFNLAGQDTATMNAIIGTLGNRFENIADQANTLRTALNRISTFADDLGELGVEVEDGAGHIRNFIDIFSELRVALEDKTDTERVSILTKIFGNRGYSYAAYLMQATTGELQALRAEIENADGAAKQMADTMTDNLASDFTIVKSAAETLSISINDKLTPSLRLAAQDAINAINRVTDEVQNGKLGEQLEETGQAIRQLLGNALEQLIKYAPQIIKFMNFMIENAGKLIKLMITLKGIKFAQNAVTGLAKVVKGVGELHTALTLASAAGTGLGASLMSALGALTSPLALVGYAITGITTAILKAKTAAIDVTEGIYPTAELQEYQALVEKNIKTLADARTEREGEIDDLETQREEYKKMAERVEELAGVENKTAAQERELNTLIAELNTALPDLGLNYDSVTGSLNMQNGELETLIDNYLNYQKVMAQTEYASELAKQKVKLEVEYDDAQAQREEMQRRKDEADERLRRVFSIASGQEISPEVWATFTEEEKRKGAAGEAKNYRDSTFGSVITNAYDEYRTATNDLTAADESIRKVGQAIQTVDTKLENLNKEIDKNKKNLDETTKSTLDYQVALEGAFKIAEGYIETNDYDALAELIEKFPELEEQLIAAGYDLDSIVGKTKEAADADNKLAERMKALQKATANYKTELKDLIGILDNVNKGTAYSTSQILDLIEKYPQLASAIHATADGYVVEAEAVKKLTQAKADNLVASAQEQLALVEAQKAKMPNSFIGNIVAQGIGGIASQLEQQIAMYQQIADDVRSGDIYYNQSDSSSSSRGSSAENDWLKERKEAAKAEEAELENQYKTEKISAEEYYNGLMDIARRYYAGIGELREEYLSAENKVYEGLKKAQEDELSTAKKLEDQLRAVKEAEDALKNAQTQQVQVYSGAAGFHAEANTAAIEKARQTLADKNYNLTETLLKNARFNGESLSERLRNIGMADIRDLLPDLSGLRLPSLGGGTTTNNNTSTRNLTYNGGDISITIQGNVDPQTMPTLKTSIEDAVRAGINAFLDEENAAGQVGGI
jgi:TP901 family phage tail tape measure protein